MAILGFENDISHGDRKRAQQEIQQQVTNRPAMTRSWNVGATLEISAMRQVAGLGRQVFDSRWFGSLSMGSSRFAN